MKEVGKMPFEKIKDINLHYQIKGKGEPLVFLHGIYFDQSGYNKLINIFSSKYKVYAIDLPMHGKSSSSKKHMSSEDITNTIKEFIIKKELNNVTIIGHSGTGIVSLKLGHLITNVKELILLDPAGVKSHDNLIYLNIGMVTDRIMSFHINPLANIKSIFVGLKNYFRNVFNPHYMKLLTDNYKINFTSDMKKLKCPVTLLWAKTDRVTKFQTSKIFLENIKNCKLIEVKGGHSWPELLPEQISALTTQ